MARTSANSGRREPSQLRRGKAFHREVQEEWRQTAESDVYAERTFMSTDGKRRNRLDIIVDDESPDNDVVAVVEIKATDWDKIREDRIRPNARRQIRQVWRYIETQIADGEHVATGLRKDVCPGIIFPKRPKDKQRSELIESMFEEEGIVVVWHDEVDKTDQRT